jgi:hypothetical protein
VGCKDIKDQAELDAALVNEEVTCVHIKSQVGVWLELRDNRGKDVEAYGSSTVRAYGSTVTAYGSTVTAYGSSTVTAFDSSTVTAFDSSTVTAYGSSTVTAFDSSTVTAYGSSTVGAYSSSTVRAYDSSTVRAYDSSTVTAYGSSTVRAYSSSTVRASKHVAVHLHSAHATVEGGVVIDVSGLNMEDTQTWIEHHGIEVADGKAVLYKALGDDLIAPYDRTTRYVIGETLVCADWVDNHNCGNGLHLSPSPVHARYYNEHATRYLRCSVAVEDIRPIEGDVPKVKVRALHVTAEVDEHLRELTAKS